MLLQVMFPNVFGGADILFQPFQVHISHRAKVYSHVSAQQRGREAAVLLFSRCSVLPQNKLPFSKLFLRALNNMAL